MRPTDALAHPADWTVTTVKEAVEIRRGLSWSKDQEFDHPRDGAVPVLRIGNIQDRLDLSNILYVAGVPEKAKAIKNAGKGWSIIVGSNGNRDRVGNPVFQSEDTDFLFASFLIAAKPRDGSGIMPEFFYRWLYAPEIQSRLSASSEGTTGLSNLSHNFFKAMEIAFPDDWEQQEIARMLDAVDAALERTRTAIDQTRRLKRGLMQRVFSEGVGHHSFIKTELGKIPCSWEVIKGKDAFRTVGGYAPSAIRFAKAWQDPDCCFMKVDDFNSSENLRHITKTKLGFRTVDNPKVATLPLGTVVIAKRGAAILKNRVRTTAVPVSLDPNLMGLQLADDLDPEFFRLQLEWRQLSRYIESSGVPQLNNKDLYPRLFLRPPKEEQQEIVKLMATTEENEDRIADILKKVEQLKRGLMQDLLTGKVRVNQVKSQTAEPEQLALPFEAA
jgi:type I restriction enzyme S subunit